MLPVPPRFPPASRPAPDELVAALAALDPLPPAPTPLTPQQLQTALFQWLAVLDAAEIGELAGLREDLDELARTLEPGAPAAFYRPALHRAGLSIERLAAWGRSADLTDRLLDLGRRLLALSATDH